MHKTIVSLAFLSSLVFAELSVEETRAKIKEQEAQLKKSQKLVAELQASIRDLEDTLPCVKEQRRECEILRKRKAEELKTHTEFGFISSKGNTDTMSYNLDTKFNKKVGKHVFELVFDGKYADDTNVETINKYYSELLYSYEFTPRLAFDYLLGFKQDKFSSFNYQLYTGPGLKYKFIKTRNHTLTIGSNLLYAQDEEADTLYDAAGNVIDYPNANNTPIVSTTNGKTQSYSSYRAKLDYVWQILPNLKLTQETTYRTELEKTTNFFVYSKTGITSKLTDMFSTGLSYKLDYVHAPTAGTRHTDRTLSANLIVDY